jgi:glycosyltransferase involved in cell wall biosynthesis
MHVGFEAKRFFTNFTGLGNYSRFVVRALSDFAPQHTYTLFSPRISSHPEYDSLLSRQNINTVGPSGFYKAFPGLWRSFGVSTTREVKQLNVYHGLSQELPGGLPASVRKIVTVHDLIFLRYPEYYNPVDVAIYKAKVTSACRHADQIIAISLQTKNDLIEFLKIDPDKISVVYQGCHPIFNARATQEERENVKLKYHLPDNFVLNVGTIEKRKNLRLLVEALSVLDSDLKPMVVIVGRATKYKDEVLRVANQLDVSRQLLFLHDVSFSDLPALYQMADVFVYPSVFEGFGIPLVEAIESGVPVISSKGSCFMEAAGPDSLYADPSDKQELAKHLQLVLSDSIKRERMVKGSMAYIQKFQPAEIARALIGEYEALLS